VIEHAKYSCQRLFTSKGIAWTHSHTHTHTHTHTVQIALPGPLKWSAKLHKYQYVELVITAVIVTFGNPSFKWLGFATRAVELLDRRILVVL